MLRTFSALRRQDIESFPAFVSGHLPDGLHSLVDKTGTKMICCRVAVAVARRQKSKRNSGFFTGTTDLGSENPHLLVSA